MYVLYVLYILHAFVGIYAILVRVTLSMRFYSSKRLSMSVPSVSKMVCEGIFGRSAQNPFSIPDPVC